MSRWTGLVTLAVFGALVLQGAAASAGESKGLAGRQPHHGHCGTHHHPPIHHPIDPAPGGKGGPGIIVDPVLPPGGVVVRDHRDGNGLPPSPQGGVTVTTTDPSGFSGTVRDHRSSGFEGIVRDHR